ncbi:MAG: hypothetical protein JST80_11910 [Bdellovibrionales bacterium]|nr:hypothetical protein [Bdellovibrionales bacterium]
MASKLTSKTLKKLKTAGFEPFYPSESRNLKSKKIVREALLYALSVNDLEAFQDVLVAYLRVSMKSRLSRKAKIGRTTLYDLMDEDKPFNPTLETLGKIFEDLAA